MVPCDNIIMLSPIWYAHFKCWLKRVQAMHHLLVLYELVIIAGGYRKSWLKSQNSTL